MRSLGPGGYAGIEKFNTLMNIPKPMTVKSYNKTVSKIIDVVNIADVVYKGSDWDEKIRVCWTFSKTSGNPVTKPKEKEKGLGGRVRLTDATSDQL